MWLLLFIFKLKNKNSIFYNNDYNDYNDYK